MRLTGADPPHASGGTAGEEGVGQGAVRRSPAAPPGVDPAGHPSRMGWLGWLGITVVLAAGVVLRFLSDSALWLDEALSVNVSALGPGEIPAALARDGLPPLHYFMLHAWMQVFGEGSTSVRALSGVLSVITLPLMYMAGFRLGGRAVGVAALLLLALNPYAIRYATEARMYSLVVLLVVVGFILVHDALRNPTAARLCGVSLTTGAMLLTHYWSFWLVAATGLVLAVPAWRASDRSVRSSSRRVLLAIGSGYLIFMPWLPTFVEQAAHTGTPWAVASRPTVVAALSLLDFGGLGVPEAALLGFLLGALFLLGLFGRPVDANRIELDLRTVPPAQGAAAVAVLTAAIGAGMSLMGQSAFATRYASVFFPLFLLVAAVGVSRLIGPVARNLVLGSVLLLGCGVAVAGIADQRTQAPAMASTIVRTARGDADDHRAVVVYCPDQLGPAVDRLLPDGAFEQLIYPELESSEVDSPGRIDWYDYSRRHDEADPAVVADAVLERAGERDVFVVSNAAYRTVGDDCTRFLGRLRTQRRAELLVAEDGEEYYEHSSLTRFPGAPPATP